MKRLTLKDIEKIKNTPYGNIIQDGTIRQMIFELDQYKQIEQELGCPLDIYVKLHKIVYIYTKIGKCKLLKIQDGFIVVKNDKTTYLPLSDYQKTWWLKENKEE